MLRDEVAGLGLELVDMTYLAAVWAEVTDHVAGKVGAMRLCEARAEVTGLAASSAYQNFRLQTGSGGGTISTQLLTIYPVPHHFRFCLWEKLPNGEPSVIRCKQSIHLLT